LFDPTESHDTGKPMYVDVSQANARAEVPPNGTIIDGKTYITNNVVDLDSMFKAPDIIAKYTRSIVLPGGARISPGEYGNGKSKSIAPWIAAIGAAAVGLYLTMK
jgi:hypothetical protein